MKPLPSIGEKDETCSSTPAQGVIKWKLRQICQTMKPRSWSHRGEAIAEKLPSQVGREKCLGCSLPPHSISGLCLSLSKLRQKTADLGSWETQIVGFSLSLYQRAEPKKRQVMGPTCPSSLPQHLQVY